MVQEQQSFLEKWGPPIGLCLTLFVVAFNVSALPPIMPRVVRDLNSSMGYIQGALVLSAVIKACFAPTCENLSKRYGRKRVFLIGLLVFATGTIAASLSPTMGTFVVTYALITGIGAVPLIGSPRDWVGRLYDDKAELRAQLALIVCSTLGGLAGALMGGWIASTIGWRWAFLPQLLLVPVIAGLVRTIPRIPPTQVQPLDWVGAIVSALGFGLTLLGISLAGEYGWWEPRQRLIVLGRVIPPYPISVVPPLVGAGVFCLGIFAAWQQRQANRGKFSLVRVGLFRRLPFLLGLLTATLHTVITTGIQFNLYQFIPAVLGLNPLQTAIAVLPFSLSLLIAAIFSTLKLVNRVRARSLITTGLALFCVGVWQLYTAINPTMQALDILPALIVMGSASGLFLSQIAVTTFSMAGDEARIEASGIYTPFQNLGTALGRTILGTALIAMASAKIVDQAIAVLGRSVTPEQRASAVVKMTQVIQTFTRQEQQEFFKQLPAPLQPSLSSIIDTAAIEAMQATILISLGLSGLCFALSLLIPKRSVQRKSS